MINFQVQAAASGVSGDPTSGYEMTLPARPSGPVELGVVFPHEWQAGIDLTLNPSGDQSSRFRRSQRSTPVPGSPSEDLHLHARRQ